LEDLAMTQYAANVQQFAKVLKNVLGWLDKAEAHAKSKGFDPQVLLVGRLAPDQFALLKQLQLVSDWAKNGLSRVAGKTPPAFADEEHTLEQIRERLKKTVAYLETLSASDFDGLETRVVPIARLPGKGALAPAYFVETVLPNFYFHVTTAYAILRHNGVDLGKKDFIGGVALQDL
jgi:hypothetical protein